MMTYKDLIFTAIGDKLEENDVSKIFFNYNIETGEPKIYAVNSKDQNIEISLTTTERMTLRMIYISKIIRQMKKTNPDKEMKNIIAELNVPEKDLKVVIEFTDNSLIPLAQ